MRPIGRIRTPWATSKACPRNPRALDPAPPCRVEIDATFAAGLLHVERFSHLILVYALHLNGPWPGAEALVFTPPFDPRPRGVFASRSPRRPNPIGLAVVRLDRVEAGADGGAILHVRDLDCVDGTPLLDLKPYLPTTDAVAEASMGWLERGKG
ncbi:MAG: tRNA (N6-threonylcarbamoyladenosine(37)-N6)-methyltransferase TrmO [Alphaproteobacteria bacterium]|nr:tRNA (N6-threonylcarbamoyladenosine(37)-N6)-methyltransferase TrmO [Alphaproteobacteria bacterium]